MGAYSTAVLADSPIHYWRCADPGGGIGHDIGSTPIHIHGLGTAISAPFGYSGPNSDGGSMDLSLVGQYANTGRLTTEQVNPFSVEMLYWNWQDLAITRHLWQIQSANQIAGFFNGTQWSFVYNGVVLSTAHNYTPQVWHHLVWTYDGASMRLYVDNFLAGPSAVAAQAAAAGTFEICSNDAISDPGHGFFSEIAKYNSALSAARVAAHFAAIDSPGMVPVFNQAGGSPSGGSSPDVSAILAAVRRTY